MPELRCGRCKKKPEQIPLIVDLAKEFEYSSPDDFVLKEEGTLDEVTGKFLCDGCYIAAGMPVIEGGRWIATPENLKNLGIE